MKANQVEKDVKLHGIKFYNIVARGIKYLAHNKESGERLGVVRNDSTIEIWNLLNSPFLERTIPGNLFSSVEAICWVGNRLFSVGIGEGIIEWNLKTLAATNRVLLTGDKACCIDYHKEKEIIAVGTEEGIINIFDVSDDDLQFHKILDRQDGRIICCKFHHTGNYLVTGSQDTVRVWDVEKGHVIHKMSTGRSEKKQETIVWCLEVLKDFTILTGDSRGRVTIWDGNMGCQIESMPALKADVLCLTVTADEQSFYCSGVDQTLKRFSKVTTTKDGIKLEQWVKSLKRSTVHSHDVLAIVAINDTQIVSGGIDGFLAITSSDFRTFNKFGPFLQKPFVTVAQESRLVLLKYVNYLEVWKLGMASDEFNKFVKEEEKDSDDSDDDNADDDDLKKVTESKDYKLNEIPEKLLELRSKNDEHIICNAISSDGKWIVYSTIQAIRLFQFKVNKKAQPSLQMVKELPQEMEPCLNTMFSSDSKSLFIVKKDGSCCVFGLDNNDVMYKQTMDLAKHHKDYIHMTTISSCSKYIVFASLCNNLSIWKLVKNEWQFYKNLPKYTFPATAMEIHQDSTTLVVAFSNQKLFEYNIEDLEFEFSTMLPPNSLSADNAISNIALDPRNPNAIIFQRENKIQVLNRGIKEAEEPKSRGKKQKIVEEKKSADNYSLNVVKSFNTHLIHLEWLGTNELLAVEVNPIALIEQLPAPLRQKKFGVS
ncbi:unnamed protein product [Diamesa serratosioi]